MHSHTNLPGAFNQTEPREIFQQTKIDLTAKVDENDPQVVNITYPAAFSEEYIRPEVRLEIGPLASWLTSFGRTPMIYILSCSKTRSARL
jgi:hypothetical protein